MISTELLKAAKGLASTRTAIEKLIATVDDNDHFSLGKLGVILANLKTAQNEIQNLTGE